MKKTIWKFALKITDRQSFEMPIDSQILTMQVQKGIAFLWILCDPKEKKETRYFETFGTGHSIHYDMGIDRNYIGTYQIFDGSLIYHVFESL